MYIMKRYPAGAARQHFAELLDAAERGEPVVIERRGVQFRLQPMPGRKASSRRPPRFQIIDPAIQAGEWTWSLGARGVRFSARGRRR
jgi:prevent-host-death family protein